MCECMCVVPACRHVCLLAYMCMQEVQCYCVVSETTSCASVFSCFSWLLKPLQISCFRQKKRKKHIPLCSMLFQWPKHTIWQNIKKGKKLIKIKRSHNVLSRTFHYFVSFLLLFLILKYTILCIFPFGEKLNKDRGSDSSQGLPLASISKTSPTELHCFSLNPYPDTQSKWWMKKEGKKMREREGGK